MFIALLLSQSTIWFGVADDNDDKVKMALTTFLICNVITFFKNDLFFFKCNSNGNESLLVPLVPYLFILIIFLLYNLFLIS